MQHKSRESAITCLTARAGVHHDALLKRLQRRLRARLAKVVEPSFRNSLDGSAPVRRAASLAHSPARCRHRIWVATSHRRESAPRAGHRRGGSPDRMRAAVVVFSAAERGVRVRSPRRRRKRIGVESWEKRGCIWSGAAAVVPRRWSLRRQHRLRRTHRLWRSVCLVEQTPAPLLFHGWIGHSRAHSLEAAV